MWRFLQRARWDAERAREMDAHIAHHIDELVASGMRSDEARQQALREFGNPARLREEIYDMNSLPVVDVLARDLRYAIRVLRKSPGFSLTVVLTLAVAIGINTAVFTVADGVLLRPLPYPQPQRLGLVRTTTVVPGVGTQSITSQHGVTWEVLRDNATTVQPAVFSTWTSGINVTIGDRASYAQQQRVGTGFFSTLGVVPAIGREFSRDEDRTGGPEAVILSDGYWRALGGDPGIVGRTMTLRGTPHVVVGIMPANFHTGVDAEVWTPLRAGPSGEGSGENYQILLRLRDGMTWQAADAELARLGAEIVQRRKPAEGTTVTFGTESLQNGMTQAVRPALLLVWAAVGVVLTIACVNLAGLMLTRGMRRTREIATRLALGSERRAIIRQLLVESIVLSAAGCIAGILFGTLIVDLSEDALAAFGIWQPLRVDGRAIIASIVLALVSCALFGIFPALRTTRVDVSRGLLAGSGRTIAGGQSLWARRALVVAQVALGVVLLAGAGLLVRTFTHLRHLNPGFDSGNAVAATVSLRDARYSGSASVTRLVEATLERLARESSIETAGVALGLPYERLLNLGFRHLDGPETSQGRMTSATYIAGDYFGALRIPIRAGRTFTASDTATAPRRVVVNEAFVRDYFEGEMPIGRRIRIAGEEREIVGVVGDIQLQPGFGDRGPVAAMPLTYLPLAQVNDAFLQLVHGWFDTSFIVRAAGPSAGVVPTIRRAVDAADPLLPFAKVRSLDDVRDAAMASPRLFMWLLVALAGTAVFLASLGIYGLISASVTERTREMGIRLALGATGGRAVRTLALPGIALAAIGVAAGTLAARSAATLLRGFVWGVSPTDPSTFLAVATLFVLIACAASVIPARRILNLDPATVLRQD